MDNKPLNNGGAMNAALETTLAIEFFLNENYRFRSNVLSGKVEFSGKPAEGEEPAFRVLTQQVQNSIVLKAKREDICEGANPKSDIQEYINSEEVATFDPIAAYASAPVLFGPREPVEE